MAQIMQCIGTYLFVWLTETLMEVTTCCWSNCLHLGFINTTCIVPYHPIFFDSPLSWSKVFDIKYVGITVFAACLINEHVMKFAI